MGRGAGRWFVAWAFVLALALVVGGGALLARPAGASAVAGTVVATAVDQDGLPVRGNCFRLQGVGFNQQLCDALDGTVDGKATFTNVPFGSYTLSQSYTPVGFAPPSPNGAAVNVPDTTPVAATLTSSRTDLRVTLRDDANQLVLGACFNVASGAYSRTICDNAANSGGSNGVTLIDYVPSGSIALTQTSGPATHDLMLATTVSVTAGTLNTTAQTTTRRAPAAFTVSSVDQDGQPVRGACWTITGIGGLCDALDGVVDGSAVYSAVPVGANLALRQSYTPIGFAPPTAGTVTVTPTAGGPNASTFTSRRTDLQITLEDQDGNVVTGACFTMSSGNYTRGPLCDSSGRSGGLNGVTLLDYAPGGSVTITQSGSILADPLPPQTITVTPGTLNSVVFTVNATARVTVTVASVDQDGQPVRGACFQVQRASFFSSACDAADGTVDGRASFANVPALTGYTLRQSYTPIGFAAPSPSSVSVDVSPSGPNGFSFTSPRTDLQVTLVDPHGDPVLGGCFNVTSGTYSRTLCDTAASSGGLNGVTLITYSPAPATTLSMTTTPAGFDTPGAVSLTDLIPGTLNQRTVTIARTPATLTLDVRAVDTNGDPITTATEGQNVGIEFTIRNTSANPAFDVNLTDTLGNSCSVSPLDPNDNQPGGPDEQVCTGYHVITATERQAGSLDVTGTVTSSNAASVQVNTSLPILQASAGVTVTLFSDAGYTTPLTGAIDQGDVLYARATVQNTGSSTLHNVYGAVNWATWGNSGGLPCAVTELPAGQSTTCDASWNVLAQDRLAGTIGGTFEFHADELTSPASSAAFSAAVNAAAATVTVSAFSNPERTTPIGAAVDQNDTLYVTVTVHNDGPSKLTNPYAYAQTSGYGYSSTHCPASVLAAGDSTDCTFDYVVSASDRQAGQVSLTAYVGAVQLSPELSETLSVPVNPAEATVSVAFFTDSGYSTPVAGSVNEGDTLYGRVTLQNTGDSRLDNLSPLVSFATAGYVGVACPSYTLAASASVDCTVVYTVSANDRLVGSVSGVAQATASQLDAAVESTPFSIAVNQTAMSAVTRAYADAAHLNEITGPLDQGDVIYYVTTVSNDGASRLDSISAYYTLPGQWGYASCDKSSLEAGETAACTFERYVSASDRQTGSVAADVQVWATQVPAGIWASTVTVDVNASDATVSIELFSDADRTVPLTGPLNMGDTVYTRITMQNTGASRLDYSQLYLVITTPSGFSASSVGGGGYYYSSCYIGTVATGNSASCDIDYMLTSTERDASIFTGRGEAYAAQLDANEPSAPFSYAVNEANASVAVQAYSDSGLQNEITGAVDQGDTVYFAAKVHNDGPSRLDDVYAVIDLQDIGSFLGTCDVSSVQAGETATCVLAWTVRLEDRAAGSITASATGYASQVDGTLASAPLTLPVNATAASVSVQPFLDVDLTQDASAGVNVGQTIYFAISVSNDGPGRLDYVYANLSLDGYGDVGSTCNTTQLQASEIATCVTSYTVTGGDGSTGHISGKAKGSASQLDAVSESAPFSIPVNVPAGTLSVVFRDTNEQEIPEGSQVPEGTQVYVDYTLANTGTGALTNVQFYPDIPMATSGGCPGDTIAAGDSMVCRYVVTMPAGYRGSTFTFLGYFNADGLPNVLVPGFPSLVETPNSDPLVGTNPVVFSPVHDTYGALSGNLLTLGAVVDDDGDPVTVIPNANNGVSDYYITYDGVGGWFSVLADGSGMEYALGPYQSTSFQVPVHDGHGGYATIDVQLDFQNAEPTAATNTVVVPVHALAGGLTGDLIALAGITDPDGDLLQAQSTVCGGDGCTFRGYHTNGEITVYLDGSLQPNGFTTYNLYTPGDANFEVPVEDGHGGSITLTVIVDFQNAAPTVPNTVTEVVSTLSGTVQQNVLAASGATDDDFDPITLRVGTYYGDDVSGNSVSVDALGEVTFQLATNADTSFSLPVDDVFGESTTLHLVIDADNTPPTVTVTADSPLPLEAVDASGAPFFFTVTALDDLGATYDNGCSLGGNSFSSGATAPLGTYTLECAVVDDAGNVGYGSIDVTVEDTTPPSLSVSPWGSVTFGDSVNFDVYVSDAVTGYPSVTCTVDPTGDTFDPRDGWWPMSAGEFSFTCTATDDANNTSGPVDGGWVEVLENN